MQICQNAPTPLMWERKKSTSSDFIYFWNTFSLCAEIDPETNYIPFSEISILSLEKRFIFKLEAAWEVVANQEHFFRINQVFSNLRGGSRLAATDWLCQMSYAGEMVECLIKTWFVSILSQSRPLFINFWADISAGKRAVVQPGYVQFS